MSTATPKKSRKALIIIGIIIAVIVLLAFMADGIVSNIAEKQFRKQMDKVLPGRYELGGLRVCLSAGTLTLTDFAITTGDSMVLDKTKPGLALRVGKLSAFYVCLRVGQPVVIRTGIGLSVISVISAAAICFTRYMPALDCFIGGVDLAHLFLGGFVARV